MIGDAFGKLFQLLKNLFEWIGQQLRALLQGLVDLLIGFFNIIYACIDAFFYFLFQVGMLAVKIFIIFFQIGKLLISLFVGLGKTITSIFYTPQTTAGNGYSSMIGKIFEVLQPMQLKPLAYICLFIISITWFISSIKIISSMRVGGD